MDRFLNLAGPLTLSWLFLHSNWNRTAYCCSCVILCRCVCYRVHRLKAGKDWCSHLHLERCGLLNAQAQSWERLTLTCAYLRRALQFGLRFSFKMRFFDSFQTRQESTNILETSENPAPVMHTWIFSIFLVTGSQLMPIQAIKPDDTNKK